MGLAASQARLLTITSRLSDNELRSQSINNAKLRLATESANASQDYINALNNANMMFMNYDINGTAMSQVLTYNALTSYSSYNNQYSLVNPAGQILVNENEAAIFKSCGGNLTAYLKAHGLKWDTTYFDPKEDGSYVHVESVAGYPDEFQNVNNNVLKDWYESYNAYVNSVEMSDFNSTNNDFVSSFSAISTVLNRGILKNNADTRIDKIVDDIKKGVAGRTVLGLNDIKNKILNNDGFIGAFREFLTAEGQDRLDQYNFVSDTTGNKYSPAVDITEQNGCYIIDAGAAGSYMYEPDTSPSKFYYWSNSHNDIYFTTTDSDGNVRYHYGRDGIQALINETPDESPLKIQAQTYLNNGILGNADCDYGSVDLSKIPEYIGFLSGDIGDFTGYPVTLNVNGATINDNKAFANFVGTVLHDIYDDLIFDEKYFNSDLFIFKMVEDYANTIKDPSYVSDFEKLIPGIYSINYKDQKVSDWLKDFIDALQNYLKCIEGEKEDQDEDHFTFDEYSLFERLKNGEITAQELRDLDALLRKLKEFGFELNVSSDEVANTYSKDFRNVVRGYILDNVIDIYGEPKYTWIDENDKSNVGNAEAKAQWYTNLFNRMKKGYAIIENGLASSKEWMEYALESGLVTMEQVDKTYNWVALDYTTCSNITEATNTDAQVAKAEAAYNKAMRDIEAKDKAYDMELRNIETEHNALEKEAETLKKVMEKNIERTMKFDQSS